MAHEVRIEYFNGVTGAIEDSYIQQTRTTEEYGQRTYGVGFPLISIGPGMWFKPPTSYKILGRVSSKPYGVTEYRSTDGAKRIVRRLTGSSTRGSPGATEQTTKWFNSDAYVGMDSQTRIRLGTEVMLKVGAKKASFGEALAESHKTIHHLVSTVKDLANALHAARKGRWGDVAKHLGVRPRDFSKGKTVSKRWLEYQYGWKPLMADIFDTHQVLMKGFREKAQIASNVRHLKDSFSYHRDVTSYAFVDAHSSVDYSAKVFYKINDSTLSKLGQIGLINPLSVAWELVPFSFVVDWLIPVGNTLEALTARLGVDFIAGYYGMRAEAHIVVNDPESEEFHQTMDSNSRVDVTEYFGYTRETMVGFPVPGFYTKSPFSITHALNALALISQLTKR